MAIHILSLDQHSEAGYIRPFSLQRDLRALADLIEASFEQELVATGSHMVKDMRQMAEWGALLHVMRFAIPLEGYVWVQDGHLLGNVTLTRESKDHWVLSNVAVAVEARGQGIAGKLVDAAIEHVRRHKGRVITLQVRADNTIAETLYAHRGFIVYDIVYDLYLSAASWPVVMHAPHPMVRTPRRYETTALHELLMESLPEIARPFQSIDPLLWRQDLWARVQRAWEVVTKGIDRTSLVAAPGGKPVGMITAIIRLLGSFYELQLYVRPEARGRIEAPLLEALFSRLDRLPHRDIRAQISASHEQALEKMHLLGFRTQRVLKQMGQLL